MLPVPGNNVTGRPQDQQRSYDQVTGCISQPPRQPNSSIFAPSCKAAEDQAGYSVRGAYRGTEDRAKEHKFENVPRTLERAQAACKAVHQIGPQHTFQGVSNGDAGRGGDTACGCEVGQECCQQNTRPGSVANEQERHESNSRRRPDRCGACVGKGQSQPKLACEDIAGSHEDDACKVSQKSDSRRCLSWPRLRRQIGPECNREAVRHRLTPQCAGAFAGTSPLSQTYGGVQIIARASRQREADNPGCDDTEVH